QPTANRRGPAADAFPEQARRIHGGAAALRARRAAHYSIDGPQTPSGMAGGSSGRPALPAGDPCGARERPAIRANWSPTSGDGRDLARHGTAETYDPLVAG